MRRDNGFRNVKVEKYNNSDEEFCGFSKIRKNNNKGKANKWRHKEALRRQREDEIYN